MSETVTEHTTSETGSDTPAPAAEALSLEDELGATYDAIEASGGDDPAPPADAEPPAGMERGPDGRFVAKEGAAPAEPNPVPEQPAAPAQSAAVPEYIAPYVADFEARGLRPDQAVNRLLDTWRKLEHAPEQTLKWLAGQYGIQWGAGQQQAPAAIAVPAPAQGDAWVDPEIAQLKAELAEMRREQNLTKAERQQAAQDAYNASLQTVTSEIQTFAKAKADKNFDSYRPFMAMLIESKSVNTLDEAYDWAVNGEPTTRAARKEAERMTSEIARAKEDAAKLASARRAAFTNVTSHVASPGQAATMEETIARSYDEIAARG